MKRRGRAKAVEQGVPSKVFDTSDWDTSDWTPPISQSFRALSGPTVPFRGDQSKVFDTPSRPAWRRTRARS